MNERTTEIQTWPIVEGLGGMPFFRAPAGVPWCAENVLIGREVKIGDGVVIRPGCMIWHDVRIWNWSVIGNFARIKPFVNIAEHVVIGEATTIENGAIIEREVFVGNACVIGPYSNLEYGSQIRPGTELGRYAIVGPGGVDPVDLGWANGYRKVAAGYPQHGTDRLEMRITAGCRNLSYSRAVKHWTAYGSSRDLTLALVQRATDIAKIKGWDIN